MREQPLVLVIEDQKGIRSLVSTALTISGFQVIDASTAKGGLLMVKTCAPDLILLDLGLPDMDGLEVLKSIRERSNTPVIVDSATGDEEAEIKVREMEADYIKKPFTMSELLAQVQISLRNNRKVSGNSDSEKCNWNIQT